MFRASAAVGREQANRLPAPVLQLPAPGYDPWGMYEEERGAWRVLLSHYQRAVADAVFGAATAQQGTQCRVRECSGLG